MIIGDPVQIRQLFQNLLVNAIKFRRKGVAPEIFIDAQLLNEKVAFSIQDNGIGIDSEYFNRIFDIFRRLHAKEEFQGTGIGLAICKKIVGQHGGTISVESTPGKGSVFKFTIGG